MSHEEILIQRKAVIEEARTWCGTPFHHRAAVKGAGVDCACLLAESYNRSLGTEFEVPEYYDQWHLHRMDEMYLNYLDKSGFIEILPKDKQPADLAISRIGHLFSHGAIIVDWPQVIQSESRGGGKVFFIRDAYSNWYFQARKIKFYSWKRWHE